MRAELELMAVPAAYWRGGTSKAVIVNRSDLPDWSDSELDAWILAAFGSPDRRQIDGMGGADALTSKFAIVGPSTRADADVDYSFFQVGIDRPSVHRDINCGNISAAIGPYALDAGLIQANDGEVVVRIHATNFDRIIHASFRARGGRPVVQGDLAIDGVPGTGAPIALDFRDTAGGRTGALLPTGHVRDCFDVDGVGEVEASFVDLANLVCYVKAERFGLTAQEDPVELSQNKELVAKLEQTRLSAAVHLGIRASVEHARVDLPGTPWLALVAPPMDWIDHANGERHLASSADISARLFTRSYVHKAYPGTGSACLGVACAIPGTIPSEMVSPDASARGRIRIGHPCGTLLVAGRVEQAGEALRVLEASLHRTARKIMTGEIFVDQARLNPKPRP